MRPLRGQQDISVATREESGVLCFLSRRGLTPWGSMGCNPEILVFPGEEHYVLDTRLDEVSLALQLLERNPQLSLASRLEGWVTLGRHKRKPVIPCRNMRIPPQLEKNHVVPISWQDEALARDSVSREVPCSALKCETEPDSLHATPKSSPIRRVPSRGTPRVPAPLHLSPFSPPERDRRVDSPA